MGRGRGDEMQVKKRHSIVLLAILFLLLVPYAPPEHWKECYPPYTPYYTKRKKKK